MMPKKKKKNKVDLSQQPMMNPEFLQMFLESPTQDGIHFIVDMLNIFIKSKWKDGIDSLDLLLLTKYISDAVPHMIATSLLGDGNEGAYLEEGWEKFIAMSDEEVYDATGKLLNLPIKV